MENFSYFIEGIEDFFFFFWSYRLFLHLTSGTPLLWILLMSCYVNFSNFHINYIFFIANG